MKRVFVLSVLLITLAAGFVVAQPWGGAGTPQTGAQSAGPWAFANEEQPELRTLDGRLELEDGARPVLIAEGEEYILRIHRVMLPELSVRDGQTVSVEGYVITVPGRDLLGDDLVLAVQALEANGTRVVMPATAGGSRMSGAMHGGQAGRMGGSAAPGRGGRR